jgi:hypothetical protein
MAVAEIDADPRALVTAALQTQKESERHLQKLWPHLVLVRRQYGMSSQEYQTALGTWKRVQTLWWENTMMLMHLG